jgi:hypothetical protein
LWVDGFPEGFHYTVTYTVGFVRTNNYISGPEGIMSGNGQHIRIVRDPLNVEKNWKDGSIIKNVYTDGSGNVYDGIKIGNQVWADKNLITTQMQDGTNIPQHTVDSNWENAHQNRQPARCWVRNNQTEYGMYGILYNAYVGGGYQVRWQGLVDSGTWRVPLFEDWTNLFDYIIDNYHYTSDTLAMALKSCRQDRHPNA